MVKLRRIAIFNVFYPLHSNVCYMVSCLQKEGYLVDLFLHDTDEKLAGDLLQTSAGVSIYRFNSKSANPMKKVEATDFSKKFARLVKKIYQLLPARLRQWRSIIQRRILLSLMPEYKLIPDYLIRIAKRQIKSNTYVAFIGVEKEGLIFSGMLAARTKVSLLYYSLELRTRSFYGVQPLASR